MGRPGAWKCAPKCSFATPFGGTVKYILAVLQAPWSPTKLPYKGSQTLSASDTYTTKLEAVPSR